MNSEIVGEDEVEIEIAGEKKSSKYTQKSYIATVEVDSDTQLKKILIINDEKKLVRNINVKKV